jgi:hypothetical protein
MDLQTTAQALFIALIVLGVLFALSALGRERHVRKLEDALVRILGTRVGHPEAFAEALSDAEDTFVHLHARIVHARVVLAPLPWRMEAKPSSGTHFEVKDHSFTSSPCKAPDQDGKTLESCKLRFGHMGTHLPNREIVGHVPLSGVKMPPPPMPKPKMPIHDLKDTPVEDRTWRGKAFLDLTPSQQSQAIADWMALSVRDNLLVRWINDDADSRWDIFKDALAIRGAAQ